MSDSPKSKQTSIPHWQREDTASVPSENLEAESENVDAPHHVEPPPSRTVLLEQASKFLEDDEIRNAPTERKITFLQSKGLTDEEVHRLLELPYQKANGEAQSVEQSSAPSPLKDAPPIITYPEFLLHSEKPPPLITASRLINTFYLFSGTAAAIYGTSKYLVEPMLESLTSARHDLFSTAQSNLDDMADKLENIVSSIPTGVPKGDARNEEDTSSDESADDTTPFFNRTVGTQTSPPTSTATAPGEPPLDPAATLASLHQKTLGSLQTSLSALVPSQQDSSNDKKVTNQIDALRYYLDSLKYPSLQARGLAESKDDAVNKFKAEVDGAGMNGSTKIFHPSKAKRARARDREKVQGSVINETNQLGSRKIKTEHKANED
ncbi:MAG: hypothetical protein Q9168_002475 [Polycauliona sp. 1 TL-2023]